MPRRKSASSLEELCLDAATTYFREKKMQRQLANQPPTLINNIYERLCMKFQRGNHDRGILSKVFIHSGAKSLHHLYLFSPNIIPLYDRIGKLCTDLLELTLGDDVDSTIGLIQRLSKLQRLHFGCAETCTDQVVAAIGKNCPLLTYLDISFNDTVNDDGLRSLSSCVKMEHLDVQATSVTVDGCLFVLDRLPKLKVFAHDYWNQLLRKLQNGSRTSRTYSLENIQLSTAEHIPILTNSFPNLRHLSAYRIHLDLNNLRWPQRLTSVHLETIRPVNIELLVRAVPMLAELTLTNCTIVNQSDGIVNAPLKNLRELRLYCVFGTEDPLIDEREMKKLLVPCTRLETLGICGCPMFTDDVISELVKSNGLQYLKALKLWSCDSILSASIIKLLEVPNPMNELIVCHCASIDILAYEEIKAYVKSKNLDLTVKDTFTLAEF